MRWARRPGCAGLCPPRRPREGGDPSLAHDAARNAANRNDGGVMRRRRRCKKGGTIEAAARVRVGPRIVVRGDGSCPDAQCRTHTGGFSPPPGQAPPPSMHTSRVGVRPVRVRCACRPCCAGLCPLSSSPRRRGPIPDSLCRRSRWRAERTAGACPGPRLPSRTGGGSGAAARTGAGPRLPRSGTGTGGPRDA